MNDHLAKPIEKDELFRVISEYFTTQNTHKKDEENHLNDTPSINGIDLDDVMASFSYNKQTVYEMYVKFAEHYKNIQTDLAMLSDDKKSLHEYVHKLKGVSGNLKIKNVFDLSKKIHDESKFEYISELIEQIQEVSADIEKYILPLVQNYGEYKELSTDELNIRITTIIKSLEQYDYIEPSTISELLYAIKDLTSNEKLDTIKNSFENGENEELIDILQQIQRGL